MSIMLSYQVTEKENNELIYILVLIYVQQNKETLLAFFKF